MTTVLEGTIIGGEAYAQNVVEGSDTMGVTAGRGEPVVVKTARAVMNSDWYAISCGAGTVALAPGSLVASGPRWQFARIEDLEVGDEVKTFRDGLAQLEMIDVIIHREEMARGYEIETSKNFIANGIVLR